MLTLYFDIAGTDTLLRLECWTLEIALTLNLLTWTKWWAPASASKWQMVFNSAFKGLSGFSVPTTQGVLVLRVKGMATI